MTNKQLNSFKNRIVKSQNSLSCLGEMMVHMDIDAMALIDKLRLSFYCKKFNVTYPYLSKSLAPKVRVQ